MELTYVRTYVALLRRDCVRLGLPDKKPVGMAEVF